MSKRHQASGWVSAVLRDYGPEAWHDDEPTVRHDATFVVLDPAALTRRCAFLRGLGATPGSASRWAIAEVSLRGMYKSSPEAIQAVMADPAALCEVHSHAWISAGPWTEVRGRYRSKRSGRSAFVVRWAEEAEAAAAAAVTDSDRHELEHEVVLGGDDLRPEIRGTLQFRRIHDDSSSDNFWRLVIRFPAITTGPSAKRREDVTTVYRNRYVLVECPGLHEILRLKVRLQVNDRGDLISDSYVLEDVDPTREGFALTLSLEPDGMTN